MGNAPSTETKRPKSQPTTGNGSASQELYPTPTGNEYDVMDKIAAELPHVIDDESRQQVEDYKQACDSGKGPMVSSE